MNEPRYGYADTPRGQIHYARSGSGRPILLLHQAPRSWDEFRELMPLLAGAGFDALAVDMPGFGASYRLAHPQRVEDYAEGCWAALDALGVGSEVIVLGHHTGALVALEMAASRPSDLSGVVLSSAPWTGPEYRERSKRGPVVDEVTVAENGTHVVELWQWRQQYYPPQPTELLNRFLADALRFGIDPAEGHRACGRYLIEDRISSVTAPTLVISGEADPFALPHVQLIADKLTNAESVHTNVIPAGTVAMVEHCAESICTVLTEFAATLGE